MTPMAYFSQFIIALSESSDARRDSYLRGHCCRTSSLGTGVTDCTKRDHVHSGVISQTAPKVLVVNF
jgi:hypothetical protein